VPSRSVESPSPVVSAKALAFLARLATDFTTVLSLPDLLEHVLQVLREETEFHSCGVALLDPHDPDRLTILATSGMRDGARGEVFRRGRGLGWVVIESGEPLIVPDLHRDRRVTRRHPELRSAILAPLSSQRHPVGVLSAYRSAPHAFTEGELGGAVEVARLHEQLQELAATDSLTGLANRRAFLDRLQAEIARTRRAKTEFCIVLLDLDRFKPVNDVYGHAVGDRVLIRASEALSQVIRESDLAARFGGDEFILLLPETKRPEALEILDRLRRVPIFIPDRAGTRASISFSWGLAAWPHDGEDPEALVQMADHRLYAMKRGPGISKARPAGDSLTPSDA
jgi:diguanylate cyclase (GGDEF)-like protein